jgi:hypothetical protein
VEDEFKLPFEATFEFDDICPTFVELAFAPGMTGFGPKELEVPLDEALLSLGIPPANNPPG